LSKNSEKIKRAFNDEENQFVHTLEKGTKEFEKTIEKIPPHIQKKVLSGKTAFFLYETYGFPIELTEEMARERGFEVDKDGFQKAFEKHQELSRQGAEQKFKGGLADNSDLTTALHTATHLMHTALRMVLGAHVEQKGSNITAERLRFDFCHNDKMTPEQIAEVEKIVNEAISRNLEISVVETSVDEAKKMGAIGLFEDRYAEKVKVYSIGDFSREICGGPHIANTSSMGKFKILKEESSSRGIRRIKAVLEK
jgi:alanyl-tRNA synthetase